MLLSRTRPNGRAGETVHVSTSPPLLVGVTAFIGESFDKVNALGL